MRRKKERRKYVLEFKQDAIKLAEKIGISNAANKLEIPLNNLQRWKSQKNLPIEKSQDILKLQMEVKKLKKELTEEKAVVEFFKKSHSFFFKGKRKMMYSFITEHKPSGLSVKRACSTCSLSRSGYFKYLQSQKQPKKLLQTQDQVMKAFYLHKRLYGCKVSY